MRISDAPVLKKMDQSYHVPFITTCTPALSTHAYLSETDNEQLRLILRDRHKAQSNEGETLFGALTLDSKAFHVLKTRLGPFHFQGLLYRWTMARALENFNYILWSFAQELLAKSELMFNQPFHLFSGRTCVQHGPFSYFLVEMAGELHEKADDIHDLVKALKTWSIGPVDAASFETTLASHLGFRIDENTGLSDWSLHELMKKAWLELEIVQEFYAHLLRQLKFNLKMEQEEPRLRFLLDDFQSLLASTRGLALGDFSSPELVENKRIRTLIAIEESKNLSMEFFELLSQTLKTSRVPHETKKLWSERESRAIINHLMDRGLAIPEAQNALAQLKTYCEEHNVSPDQLLEAELHRIHPFFDNNSSLFLKKAGGSERLSESFHNAKQHIVHKKDLLLHHISQRLIGITTVSLLLVGFAGACGVKTAPRSDVLDARPSVPYHAEQRDYPKKKSQEALPPPVVK